MRNIYRNQHCYKRSDQPEIEQFTIDKVKNSIFVKRPHELIKTKLSSIVDDRMAKFKGAVCQYYIQCCDCRELVTLRNKLESHENLMQCLSCHALFKSQLINDWMIYKEEDFKGINKQQETKLTPCYYSIDRKQYNQMQSNTLTSNQDVYQECFDIIASKLDENSMFRLGVKLNLSYKDVDEISNRNIRNYQKIYQILTLWREQSGQQADLNQIITLLLDMNQNTIADKVHAKLDSSM